MKDIALAHQTRERRQVLGDRDQRDMSGLLFSNSRLIDFAKRPPGVFVDALRLGDTGITFGRVISGGHEVALDDPDCVTVLIPTKGHILMETGPDSHRFDSGALVMVEAEKRRTRVIAPKGDWFTATTILIPRHMARPPVGSGADAARRTDRRMVRQINSLLGCHIRQLLPDLADDVFRQPGRLLSARAREEFLGLIEDLAVETFGDEPVAARPIGGIREFRRVSQACDIIRARSDEALSLTKLAAEIDVSPRCLQLSFQSVHGMSPRQYLQRLRLDRAHARLLARDETISVTDAAMMCGFQHLGRFSQAYRRAFGELPVETLGRRGGRRAVT